MRSFRRARDSMPGWRQPDVRWPRGVAGGARGTRKQPLWSPRGSTSRVGRLQSDGSHQWALREAGVAQCAVSWIDALHEAPRDGDLPATDAVGDRLIAVEILTAENPVFQRLGGVLSGIY